MQKKTQQNCDQIKNVDHDVIIEIWSIHYLNAIRKLCKKNDEKNNRDATPHSFIADGFLDKQFSNIYDGFDVGT